MSDAPREFVVTYASAAEAVKALKKMRGFGLGAPRDHLIVEGLRAILIVVPIGLVYAGLIGFDHAIATYCGYFALRWFNALLKPAILARFGPRFAASELTSPVTMTFNKDGVRSETENGLTQLNWPAIPSIRVFKQGVILRIASEQSLSISATHMPEGITPEIFGNQVRLWKEGASS